MITTKKYFLLTLLVSLILTTTSITAQEASSKFTKVQELGGIEEYLYEPNGMNLLLVQDNSAPVVTVQIVYHVGSKNEVTGNTGSTHLLEHLMFKGTEKFNKRNSASINDTLKYFGAKMNATTWNDRTNYYETIPSNKIELALEIEADRMRNSLLLKEDKEAEMTVVRNEFERAENNPNRVLSKEIWATAYMAYPYHHSTIGWESDIENMPIEALHNFYNTYYWPNNATLTIIGDFQKDNLFKLVDQYFGKISKAPHDLPQLYTTEPIQYGPRKVTIKKSGQQGVMIVGYKIPGRLHEDLPALTILGELLGSGTSSVLNKTFVDSGLAYYGYAGPSNFKEVGLFTVGLGFEASTNYDDLNKKLLETIESVKENGVNQEDVDRIISKLNVQTILYRDGSGSIAGELNEAIAGGDWRDFVNGSKRLSMVTAEDVKRVAIKYLVEDQSTTGYFIPVIPGSNNQNNANPSNLNPLEEGSGKFYYRSPNHTTNYLSEDNTSALENSHLEENISSNIEETQDQKEENTTQRKNVNGIDVITVKTGVLDFVTVQASFPISHYLTMGENEVISNLTMTMLSKGTTKNDKFEFSQKLEKLGTSIGISSNDFKVNIGFKCLTKDIPEVINLMAEKLRYPLFDEKEFELVKQQFIGNLKNGLTNPGNQGNIAFTQAIYSNGHPNYISATETTIKNVERATLEEVKNFHNTYFGYKDMHVVAVGDVDNKAVYDAIEYAFKGWKEGQKTDPNFTEPEKVESTLKVVTIPQKPSAELIIGQYTGIKRTDTDYYPFYIGNFVLGGGFSGRLMKTVRDEEGLTYSIGSSHNGHTYTGGHWEVNASFNPNLFDKGLNSTMVQIKKWANEGITEEELKATKSNLIGSFKVGLSSTAGLAGTILSFVERGLDPDYVNQYPKQIDSVTLEHVNNVIKKYIDVDKLIIIKSGSLDENGNPLN